MRGVLFSILFYIFQLQISAMCPSLSCIHADEYSIVRKRSNLSFILKFAAVTMLRLFSFNKALSRKLAGRSLECQNAFISSYLHEVRTI